MFQFPIGVITESFRTDIRTAVIDGNTYYYFKLTGDDRYYVVEATLNNEAALFNVGDTVTVSVIQPITENLIGTSDINRGGESAPAEDITAEDVTEEITEAAEENG